MKLQGQCNPNSRFLYEKYKKCKTRIWEHCMACLTKYKLQKDIYKSGLSKKHFTLENIHENFNLLIYSKI